MGLYTKLGSIPTPLPDGITEAQHTADGWVRVVQPKPAAGEGEEVVWLNWEWVVRDTKPADEPGYQWNWNHTQREWVKCECGITMQINEGIDIVGSSADISLGFAMSADIVIDLGSADPV